MLLGVIECVFFCVLAAAPPQTVLVQTAAAPSQAAINPPVYGPHEPGVTVPRLLSSVDPKMPYEEAAAHHSGDVQVTIVVGVDGVPTDLKVTKPSYPGFNEAALDCVRQYRFKPGTRDGVPVPVRMTVVVSFHIS